MQQSMRIILLSLLLCLIVLAVTAQDLTTLEQHTETLRAQLREVMEKEATLEARRQQLDEELRPENVQNRAALTGILDADAAREQVRKQLEGEKARVEQQLELLATSHARLETAIAEAEAEAVRRRAAALTANQPTTSEPSQPTTATGAHPSVYPSGQRRVRPHRHSHKRARRG